MKRSRPGNRFAHLAGQPLEDRNAPALFGPADNTVATGVQPQSIAVADFNGDGNQDLAVANVNGNELTILLGDGSGGFSPAPGSPIAISRPYSVAAEDFNGDGKPDLAVANNFAANGTVSVLVGDGTGGFSQGMVAACPNAVFMAVGDFNGDGNQDLAATNNGSGGTVTVLLGNGGAGFSPAPASPFAAGNEPRYVVVSDLNGDGTQDLAVTNFGSNDLTVLLGNGSGGFNPAAGSPVTVGTNPSHLAAGDFNGDGRQDIAVPNSGSNDVTILLGSGSGGFAPGSESPIPVGSGPTSVAVGDFNGDGKQDIAVTCYGSNNLPFLLGNGGGGFGAADPPAVTGIAPIFVATGDFNSDGRPDLAVANYIDNDLSIFLNHGGVRIAEAGSAVVSEGGLIETYTVVLNSRPSSDVTVNIDGGSQLRTDSTSVTFTPANWSVPQFVTVSAVDDFVVEGDHSGTVTHTVVSVDANFNGVTVASISATILDNDHAGVVADVGGGIAVGEGGATDAYTIRLASQPTADVVISISADSQVTTTPTSLTFTAADWNVPQAVTVTAVDDLVAEGTHTGTISHRASSADPDYDGVGVPDIVASVTDDDICAPANTVVVREDDGDKVTWRLRGPGTLVFSQADPDLNGIGPVKSLYVTGTDPNRSTITLSVARARGTGDGLTTVSEIGGSDLRFISARKANLVGRGVDISGSLRALAIRDIENGADILAAGAPTLRTTITARHIGDGTAVALGSRIGRLTAARFGQGTITAPSLGTLSIRGDAKAGLPADFRGSVTLTGAGITVGRAVLSAVNVRGTVTGAQFRVAGTVNSFRSGAFVDSQLFVGFDPTNPANPLAGGNFTDGLKLVSFAVTGLKDSTTPAFDNSYVAADIIGRVSLRSVDAANVSTYGIIAQHIGRAAVRDSDFRLDPELPTPQGVGTFEIWIV